MSVELTQLSAVEFDHVLYGQMTPAMAAAYLRDEKIPLRTFSETLQQMYPGEDLLPRLTDFFLLTDSTTNPQSLNKKLRNWMSGRNQPASRADYFRIAFALRLEEQQLNYLLGLFTDYGIQYRNGWEVIFAWFLRNGYGYLEAREFFATLPPVPGVEQMEMGWNTQVTHELQNEFQMVRTTTDLRACYEKNLAYFGTLHLRSYYYFERYLNLLIHPAPAWDDQSEPDYSIDAVMETYLSMQMPSQRKRSQYTLIQKLLKQNWPNTTAIKNIRSHTKDVPRKLLLLFYVATENISGQEYPDWEESTLKDRVEDHWWSINGILSDCGMAKLDPRNPFDWLILYAISANEDEFMSDRMEQVIQHMFPDSQ